MEAARELTELRRRQAFEKNLTLETKYMAAEGYVESTRADLRKQALKLLVQEYNHVYESVSDCFDTFIPYLAIKYFDRYISKITHEEDLEIDLITITCFFLSWKQRTTKFNLMQFLEKKGMSDKRKSIYEMEATIVEALNWEMRDFTAFIFQPYFVENIPLLNSINLNMVNQIIIQGEGDITFTKFRPSIIAASAFLTACKIQKFDNYQECKYSFINCGLNEEMLQDCTEKTYTMWTSLMGSTDEILLNEAVEKDGNIGWPLNFPLRWTEM